MALPEDQAAAAAIKEIRDAFAEGEADNFDRISWRDLCVIDYPSPEFEEAINAWWSRTKEAVLSTIRSTD